MSSENLIGRYKLKSHGTYDQQKQFTKTSSYIKGELSYGAANELSVLILFSENPQSSREFLAYVGAFRLIDGKNLSHDISLCNNQTRNNTQELREYKLEGDELTLTATLVGGGYFEAIWQKL